MHLTSEMDHFHTLYKNRFHLLLSSSGVNLLFYYVTIDVTTEGHCRRCGGAMYFHCGNRVITVTG